MKRRPARADTGYTLIELIISITLLATITGALVATFITTNNANANTSERIHESNDAQLTAGFWTADAQAAGGVDPLLGATDPTLGVSKTDMAGCGSGALVSRFRWREWSSRNPATTADTYVTRVAAYFYDSGTNELRRQTCADGTPGGVLTLATRVASVPEVRCDGSTSCPSLPNTVSITVTETNDPPTTGGSPFKFTLNATVRSNDKTAPTATTATSTPLLALGSGSDVACDANTPTGLFISGNSTVVVNGDTVVNATNRGTCHAVNASGSLSWYGGSAGIAPGGDCSGNRCSNLSPSTAVAVGNPFAGLSAPSTAGCGSGTNPPMVSGQYQQGTYPNTLTLSGAQVMAPGTYVLCNGIAGSSSALSPGVFLYVAGGTLTKTLQLVAPTTGTYAGIAVWNGTTTSWTFDGGANINLVGVMYAPNADVTVTGNASFTVSALIARRIFFIGTQGTTITGSGTPGSPTVTATTSTTALRHVNVSWTPPYFQGTSAISNYQYRVDTGAGFGGWINVGLTTTLDHTCGTSNTMATTCKYQVRAFNAQGFGSPSNIAVADSLADSVAPIATVTAPANGGRTGLSTTITGTAGNTAGDSATVVVSLYAGANCTGTVQTFNVTRTAGTWSVGSGPMTAGAKSVCATQSDTAGNVGAAGPINFTAGQVTNLVVTNGGTVGKIDKTDVVAITFGQAMNPGSMCTGWNGTTVRKSSTVVVAVKNNDAATGGNDSLTVTDTSCPTFTMGKIDLGTTTWVGADTNFSDGNTNKASSVVFDATKTILTITLGTGSGSGAGIAAQTMTYTPDAIMLDSTGAAMTATGYAFPSLRF